MERMPVGTDSADGENYRFLTHPGANLQASIAPGQVTKPELRLFGNRAGILSLANVLLWLIANSWRREILSLGELPFIELALPLSVCIRLSEDDPDGQHGRVVSLDGQELLEWLIAEEDRRQAAFWVHRLACDSCHEHDGLAVQASSHYEIHVRMTNAASWLESGTV